MKVELGLSWPAIMLLGAWAWVKGKSYRRKRGKAGPESRENGFQASPEPRHATNWGSARGETQ